MYFITEDTSYIAECYCIVYLLHAYTSSYTAVDCGPPPSGGSLVVSYSSTLVNATSKYTCRKCFEMKEGSNGSVEMSCSDHGRWSGRRPICKGESHNDCLTCKLSDEF